ncbi:MAG TPA: sulfotransferase domain-containing protein [Candidatus Binatia bacterium]|nr:sulfotransferase domain-containing protein [Candidatus Binatia bacterium]
MKFFRHNFSKRARRYSRADVFIVSIPKSGRTWLRVFLHAYFSAACRSEFTLDAKEFFARCASAPRFVFTHDVWAYLNGRKMRDRVMGKPLIPRRAAREKRVLMLARDPRDVMVSLFFQLSKRVHRYGGDLPGMIRHRAVGIHRIVGVMNGWLGEWGGRSNFKLVRYEDCRRRPEESFREILKFIGCHEVDESALAQAIQFSSFENMRALEASGGIQNKKIGPADERDPESFKVRRGRVGGFAEYLSAEDIGYVEDAMRSLDRRFGYEAKSVGPAENLSARPETRFSGL